MQKWQSCTIFTLNTIGGWLNTNYFVSTTKKEAVVSCRDLYCTYIYKLAEKEVYL
jgi:hypothetical protein